MQQKKIFLSHATKDKPLADKLTDLLTAGCAVNPNDILCTSLEGKGIPAGTTSFIEYLRQQMQKPELVILLLSERFFASQFCLCELGAVWGMNLPTFPLVVPPLDKTKIKATLAVTQMGDITDGNYLHDLRDVLKKLGTEVPTATWSVKRDAFLGGLDAVLKSLPGPVSVSAKRLKEAEEKYQAALTEIGDNEKAIRRLKDQIADLEKCKDREQVKVIDRNYSSHQKQFESLIEEARTALDKLCKATRSAMFFQERDEYLRLGSNRGCVARCSGSGTSSRGSD